MKQNFEVNAIMKNSQYEMRQNFEVRTKSEKKSTKNRIFVINMTYRYSEQNLQNVLPN